jgi:methylated-DNA-protein-cysteine methyltransferase related protein
MNAFAKVYSVVAKIPKGKVMTYGQVAKTLGLNPRVVGFALHANKDPQNIPCHRVIKSDGTLAGYAFGGAEEKKRILEEEGILFENLKVKKDSILVTHS